VERRVEVIVDAQKMNGFLVFHPLPGLEKGPEKSEVEEAIRLLSIKYGIMEEKIQGFIESYIPDVPFLFARGVMPEPSQDVEIVYNFDLEKLRLYCTGKLGAGDKNSYKQFITKKGSLIARKTPPVEGKPGIDIFGNEIKPKAPKDRSLGLYQGKNTVLLEDEMRLVSEQEGILRLEGERINVDNILVISGGVDVGVGNIDFEGSVMVEGMVMPGFVVKAREDIKVTDIVEGATLIAGRDIEINSGVKGRNKAFISSGRDIKVKFVENAELEANRDVIIANAIVNSTVKAKRDVLALGDPGGIIGGAISAGHIVEAKEIGSDMNLKTTIEVGIDPDLRQRSVLLRSQIAVNFDNLNKLTLIVKKLRELKNTLGDKFPADKIEYLVKSINAINNLNAEIPSLQAELEEIENRIKNSAIGSKIIAQKLLKPGTEVTIRDRKFYATRPLEKVILVLEEGEVRVGGYNPSER
jgi:uncharacterized protein (DUF342 family)